MEVGFNCKDNTSCLRMADLLRDAGFEINLSSWARREAQTLRVDLATKRQVGWTSGHSYQTGYDSETGTTLDTVCDVVVTPGPKSINIPVGDYTLESTDGETATVGCQKVDYATVKRVYEEMTELRSN